MDFATEEELCQQAYEVWLRYACPACEGDRSAPPPLKPSVQLPAVSDGPCSILPHFLFVSSAFADRRDVMADRRTCLSRQ